MIAVAHCDGSGGSPRGSTCACVVADPDTGEILGQRSKVLPLCTNNIAEWEGLILALEVSEQLGVTHLTVKSDSQVIVNQATGVWQVKAPEFRELKERAWEIGEGFEEVEILWVPREQNTRADALCTLILNLSSPKDGSARNPFISPSAS